MKVGVIVEKKGFLDSGMIKYALSSIVRRLKQNKRNDTKPLVGKMTGCTVKRPKLVLSLPLVILAFWRTLSSCLGLDSLFTNEEIRKDNFLRFFHSKIL